MFCEVIEKEVEILFHQESSQVLICDKELISHLPHTNVVEVILVMVEDQLRRNLVNYRKTTLETCEKPNGIETDYHHLEIILFLLEMGVIITSLIV